MRKATNEQLLEAYGRLGSIWKVANEFGMCGQSVWERLRRLGIEDKDKWTSQKLEQLEIAYSRGELAPVDINKLAQSIGKNKSNISRKARTLGLTSRHRLKSGDVKKQMGERSKAYFRDNPHPRGGYKVGKEIRICPTCGGFFEAFPSSPQKYCGRNCSHFHPQSHGNQGYSRGGKRGDLNNQYFRSTYEANYARYLNFLIQNNGDVLRWEFEPETFEFRAIRKGTCFYTPDFRVYFKDGHIEYHEVKGWDHPKGRTARGRFNKYYPQYKLVLIGEDFFRVIKKQGMDKLISGWE